MLIRTSYKVTFRIPYKTQYGKELYVIGSSAELGAWKDFKHKMKWSEGHIWSLTLNLSEKHFEYKYVVKGHNETLWEPGPNRVCVLDLLAKDTIVLDSVWDSYRAQFVVYYPLKDPAESLYIIGDIEQLGKWYTFPPVCQMTLGSPRPIMNTGQEDCCWEAELVLPNSIREFGYKYVVFNKDTKQMNVEREVGRYFKLSKDSYHDFLKKQLEDTGSYEYNRAEILVNGKVTRFDANVALEGLLFDEVLEGRLYVGPYPQKEKDVELLKEKAGIGAVLNLQTERDFKQRMIDIVIAKQWVEAKGMQLVKFPINDFDPVDLAKKLIEAAKVLKDLLEKYQKVYVHCTAGMGRAASVVVMYLVLYEGMKPGEACTYIKSKRKAATPNMAAIEKALEMTK